MRLSSLVTLPLSPIWLRSLVAQRCQNPSLAEPGTSNSTQDGRSRPAGCYLRDGAVPCSLAMGVTRGGAGHGGTARRWGRRRPGWPPTGPRRRPRSQVGRPWPRRPGSRSTAAAATRTLASSATSRSTGSASTSPAMLSSLAVAWAWSASRALTSTVAPSPASWRAAPCRCLWPPRSPAPFVPAR
jgi:hypothetical protein